MVFFIGIFDWILEVQGYTYLHHAILAVYLGSYIGIFGLLFGFISRRSGSALALFAAPFFWVSLEYIRSNFFFLALPWGLLAHSQYQNPLIIQVASLAGTYGVSFLIVLVNAALAAVTILLSKRFNVKFLSGSIGSSQTGLFAVMSTAAVLLSASVIYGYAKISKPIEGKEIKLSLVQSNIEQEKKWDPRFASYVINMHFDLTREASADKPDLIIWPETATPRPINRDPELFGQIWRLVNTADAPLLLGSSQTLKFKKKEPERKVKFKNSAFLLTPRTAAVKRQRYDKLRLMPFGEYLPYNDTIPWSWIKAEAINSFLPGDEYTVFQLPEGRFSVTICWENLFADLVRQFVKRGAQFIVNITNEAWFGETAAPYQFLSMSVFRAVENRVYVVRCANTGISAFIDPCGRVVDRVKDESGGDIFVRGVLTHPVVLLESDTLYTRYGDWFVWVCMACSVAFVFFAFFKKGVRSDLASDQLKE
jgi:apolipoprotein N-acyltransferase